MGSTASKTKGRRVSIDLTPTAAAEVDRLRTATDLSTADLFRFALHLFRLYVDERSKGNSLYFAKDDDPTHKPIRIEMPLVVGRVEAAAACERNQ